MRFSFSTDPKGYGHIEGTVEASSWENAGKKVWDKLATKMTTKRAADTKGDRVNRAMRAVDYSGIRLVNEGTGEDWSWQGVADGWKSYKQLNAEKEAYKQRVADKIKRGYHEHDGVKLAPVPMALEPVVDVFGNKPEGSSGYAILYKVEDGVALISDGLTVGRFWPAVWDVKRRRWVVIEAGEQWAEGKVTARYEVSTKRKGTREALQRRHKRRTTVSLGSMR